MAIVITLVVLGLAFALVTWRRSVAGRWRADAARDASANASPRCAKVWVQRVLPRRSLRAGQDRVTGELCVDPVSRSATFGVPDGQEVVLTNIRDVQMGARGSDFVNSWIEVHCDVNGQAMVVYVNDAKWLGWRSLLTRSNAHIADALAGLTANP